MTAAEHFQRCEAGCSGDGVVCREYVRLRVQEARRVALQEAAAIVRAMGAAGNGAVDDALASVESRIAVRALAAPEPEGE